MYDIIFLPMRLQPMHIGHLELISKSSELGIVVKILLYNTKTQDEKNPLTEIEKLKILKKTIQLENLNNIEIYSMPYFKENTKRFEFVNKNINLTKNSLIISGDKFIQNTYNNFTIKTPKDVLGTLIDISGTKIRELIKQEKQFRHHLSSGTLHYLEELKFLKD
jgi:nicotinamide mononucleotide adenylyltransferase